MNVAGMAAGLFFGILALLVMIFIVVLSCCILLKLFELFLVLCRNLCRKLRTTPTRSVARRVAPIIVPKMHVIPIVIVNPGEEDISLGIRYVNASNT